MTALWKQLPLPYSLSEATALHEQIRKLQEMCEFLNDWQGQLEDQLDTAQDVCKYALERDRRLEADNELRRLIREVNS